MAPLHSSLLVSPDRRRRLQQQYEEAVARLQAAAPDRARIGELLAECLRADPGNILYLQALLANARAAQQRGPGQGWWHWLRRGSAGGQRRVVPAGGDATKDAWSLLTAAPDLLRAAPHDARLLQCLAQAAAECELDEAERRYWQLAAEAAPSDADAARGLARALTWQGRFDEARCEWERLLGLEPGDAEATQAVEDLTPIGPESRVEPAEGAEDDLDPARHLERAEQLAAEGRFCAAEAALAAAQAAGGPVLVILERRERLQLERSADRLARAQQRALSDPAPRARALVQRLEAEHHRLHIDIGHLRCERWPTDWQLRVELAARLMQAGNFSGAIQRLDEALRLAPEEPAILLALGEGWQHLRQFGKALDYYQQAAARLAPTTAAEVACRVHYRAAVLAAAMGQVAAARGHLQAVVARDAAYKDAAERLRRLASVG